jgi:hypothetical protein
MHTGGQANGLTCHQGHSRIRSHRRLPLLWTLHSALCIIG